MSLGNASSLRFCVPTKLQNPIQAEDAQVFLNILRLLQGASVLFMASLLTFILEELGTWEIVPGQWSSSKPHG